MNIYYWLKNVNLYKSINKNIYNDSLYILKFVLKKDLSWIITNFDYKLKFFEINYLNIFLIRRLRGEPLCYIFNKCYFYSSSYEIYFDIFIPRKDTEIMVEYSINLIKKKYLFSILDLGTGCGVIALSIAKFFKYLYIVGLDINKSAINLCKYNSCKLNINNVFFYISNWFDWVKSNNLLFDLIICNPPYINKYYFIKNKNINDLRFESYYSLFSSINGIKDIFFIINESFIYLNYDGWLILEHSFNQMTIVQYFFYYRGYKNVYTYRDYSGNYRFTIGKK